MLTTITQLSWNENKHTLIGGLLEEGEGLFLPDVVGGGDGDGADADGADDGNGADTRPGPAPPARRRSGSARGGRGLNLRIISSLAAITSALGDLLSSADSSAPSSCDLPPPDLALAFWSASCSCA